MKYVESNGGPLIALPMERAEVWFGTVPSPGTKVPAGWEWSGNDDDPVRTDYDRACGRLRSTHVGSYGGVGLVKVGDGDALVFLRPTSTTFLTLPDGGAFLRNVHFATTRAARKAVDAVPRWKKTRIEIDLADGRVVLFDAAYPYRARPMPPPRGPEMLTARLAPGRYAVMSCDYMPAGAGDFELYAYRLVRAASKR